jgi:hypothetical protein
MGNPAPSATADQLALLASAPHIALVDNTDAGRDIFKAALRANPDKVQADLFKRVGDVQAASAARPINAAEAQAARSGHPTEHGMSVPPSRGGSVVRSGRHPGAQTSVARPSGPRITEAND